MKSHKAQYTWYEYSTGQADNKKKKMKNIKIILTYWELMR